jgi:hypothetical protein
MSFLLLIGSYVEGDYKVVPPRPKLFQGRSVQTAMKNEIAEIQWTHDAANNTLEGRIGDELLYDIELHGDGSAIVYQMKKHVGNYEEFDTVEEAKEFCQKKHKAW